MICDTSNVTWVFRQNNLWIKRSNFHRKHHTSARTTVNQKRGIVCKTKAAISLLRILNSYLRNTPTINRCPPAVDVHTKNLHHLSSNRNYPNVGAISITIFHRVCSAHNPNNLRSHSTSKSNTQTTTILIIQLSVIPNTAKISNCNN